MVCILAQEKRSAYAPSEEQPVRYDGIYRIARAYRKPGAQKQLVCRYVFIRCDNEPAPWSSEGAPHMWMQCLALPIVSWQAMLFSESCCCFCNFARCHNKA